MPFDRDVKVSVVVLTYNHERYIAQALDGVLEQRTTFPVEIIITEDHSTDGTREIVRDYQRRYPDRIRLMMSIENLNDNSVLSRGLRAAHGQYVAILDGDDWWTSTDKLTKQVQVLDADADASICFHNVEVNYEAGDTAAHLFHLDRPINRLSAPVPKHHSGLEDLVGGNFIQTCSVMFRADALGDIPAWYAGLPVGDWPLYVLLAQNGHAVYLDEVLATYRVHPQGMWSEGLSRYRDPADILSLLRTYDILDEHLSRRYHDIVTTKSSYLHRAAAIAYFRQGAVTKGLRKWRDYGRTAGPLPAFRDRGLWVSAGRSIVAGGSVPRRRRASGSSRSALLPEEDSAGPVETPERS